MDKIAENLPARRVGILLIDGFALMSYAALSEPFRAANLLAGRSCYIVQIIPQDGLRAVSSSGASISGSAQIGQFDFDIVFVVAGGDPMAVRDPGILAWLRALDRRRVTLGGVSGGPAVLARAGVMENRRMTIHWEHAEALREAYPELMLERALYVFDRNRISCAGGTAPMDMMHEMISQHHGTQFARSVSDWFLHTETRPASGPQRAGRVARFNVTNRSVLIALEAMENNLAEPVSLSQLARFSNVSPRQLNRLFTQILGESTMSAYRNIRLDVARRLLEQTALPVTEVAIATGFPNPAHFSVAFRTRFKVSPVSTRRRPV